MGARIATIDDAARIAAFWRDHARDALDGAGYVTAPLTRDDLARELASPRSTWVVAQDDAGVLRSFIEAVRSKSAPDRAWVARFALHPGVSLRSAREHRDAMARELWQRLPSHLTLEVPYVRAAGLLAREYCDAVMAWTERPDGTRDYVASVAALRAATEPRT